MAFKDLEEGILEEFSSHVQYGGYLRANEDRSFRVKKRGGTLRRTEEKTVAQWCVVQCRLCAIECPSRKALVRHFAKCHAAAHRFITTLDKQYAVANARTHRRAPVVHVIRVQCLHCRRPFGSDDALRLHQRKHHPLEHVAASLANRHAAAGNARLYCPPAKQLKGPRWWWSQLAPHKPDHE